MAGVKINDSVTNQTGVPMVFALPFALFPAAGVPYRIGFRTDSPYGIYLDNGSAFVLIAETAAAGVLTLSSIGSAANANGATITGTVLNLQPADASFGGVLTTGAQTIAGSKTLSSALISTFVGEFLQNTGASTDAKFIRISNTTGDSVFGIDASIPTQITIADGGIAYATILKSVGSNSLILGTLSKAALTINTLQQVSLTQNLSGTTATFTTLGLTGALSGTTATFTTLGLTGALSGTTATLTTLGLTGALSGTTANFTGQLTLGSTITNGTFVYTLPGSTGTFALSSDLTGYLPLIGGTLSGALASTFVGQFIENTGVTTSAKIIRIANTSGDTTIGTDSSTPSLIVAAYGGVPYATVLKTQNLTQLILGTNSKAALVIDAATQNVTLKGSLSGLTAGFSGAVTFDQGISINAATATVGGIQFPATQVPIANVNNLDDYEEGTWTPGLKFATSSVGIVYSSQVGTYTKIGRQVTVNGFFSLSNKGAAPGQANITGLPFTIANTSGNYAPASLRINLITYTGLIQSLGNINDTTIGMEQVSTLGVLTDITNTNFSNTSSVILSFSYFV